MSVSEPCSPTHGESIDEKWLSVASCVDLLDEEGSSSAIHAARSSALQLKKRTIQRFLAEHKGRLDEHVDSLRAFAKSTGGLIDDSIRKIVWPVLARNMRTSRQLDDDHIEGDDVTAHKEWHQVQLDVQRTLARFPPNMNEEERSDLQDVLSPLIIRVLSTNKKYQYYQGFHDVLLTLLLVLGEKDAEEVAKCIVTRGTFHDFLSLTLEEGVVKDLNLIFVILSRVDPELESVMREAQLGPLFALSWPLTWFSHSLHNYAQIVRVFDVFLAGERLLPMYLSAACVMYQREQVFTAEREMPILHHLLGTLPRTLPIDSLISDALYLARLIPPSLLTDKYVHEYVPSRPPPRHSPISRYALQTVFVVGAMSAAAGYYYLSKHALIG